VRGDRAPRQPPPKQRFPSKKTTLCTGLTRTPGLLLGAPGPTDRGRVPDVPGRCGVTIVKEKNVAQPRSKLKLVGKEPARHSTGWTVLSAHKDRPGEIEASGPLDVLWRALPVPRCLPHSPVERPAPAPRKWSAPFEGPGVRGPRFQFGWWVFHLHQRRFVARCGEVRRNSELDPRVAPV